MIFISLTHTHAKVKLGMIFVSLTHTHAKVKLGVICVSLTHSHAKVMQTHMDSVFVWSCSTVGGFPKENPLRSHGITEASFSVGQMPFLSPSQQRQGSEKS